MPRSWHPMTIAPTNGEPIEVYDEVSESIFIVRFDPDNPKGNAWRVVPGLDAWFGDIRDSGVGIVCWRYVEVRPSAEDIRRAKAAVIKDLKERLENLIESEMSKRKMGGGP